MFTLSAITAAEVHILIHKSLPSRYRVDYDKFKVTMS